MRPPRWTLRTALSWVAAFAVLLALLTRLADSGSNCGGNSAAIWNVRQYYVIVELAAASRPDHCFTSASATPQEREDLAAVARGPWTGGARYLVSTQPYRAGARGPRRLIAVCDTPFRNVPRRLIPPPPTHAAAFSDGSVALLSVAQYAALDHSVLVPLDQLLADQRQSSREAGGPSNEAIQRTRLSAGRDLWP
jgi:hypothetical protein